MRHTTEHDLLESYHASGRMDTEGFFSFLSSVRAAADEQIAHLIDWRSRSGLDGPYEIDAFLTSIPNLRNRPVVLDAVIDVVLRSHARGVGDSERAITDLRTKHPDLCDAIDAAVVLGSLVGTTRMSSSEIPERTLPEEIGLPTPEGRSRYVLRERMGAGANGRVYLAEDRLLSSEGKPVFVAVKFLSRLGGSTLADRVAAAEAIKARRVRHTNVASALDRGVTSDGASYVVFEHVAGGNLHGHIRGADHRLSPRAAATLVRDIARGTQAIHSAGLLHCDLKPSNVLMEIDGTPRITDFGLAQWEGEVRDLPSMVELGGTLGFGAPEQFAPGSVLNTATDTYALGGLLLWCLRGVAPNGSSAEEARRNLDSANVRTIRTRAAAGGAWAGAESERDRSGATTTTNTLSPSAIAEIDNALLAAICARALSCDPTRRYQSAEALANDLERVLRDEGLVWAKEDPAARLTRWVRRERAAAALAAALILVASAGTALVLTQSKKALIAEHQREVADLRAERVNATISQARSTLADSLLMTRASYGNGLSSEWLTQVTILQTLTGPTFDLSTPEGKEVWSNRIDAALQSAEAARSAGATGGEGRPTVTSCQWRLIAGFWLLTSHRYTESRATLAQAEAEWLTVVDEHDGLVDLTRKLLASAIVLGPSDPVDVVIATNSDASVASGSAAAPPSPPGPALPRRDFGWARDCLSHPDASELATAGEGVRTLLRNARGRLGLTMTPAG
ncbi:MAG: serine/threonine protein kinase [Phycisphaerales bacterium]|nr:MAG: serine/threonine protein kinase [Phycisphaerales bacterium]